MRLADLQRDPAAEPASADGRSFGVDALPLDVRRERTFDTPEFAGMRFLEVESGSALNRVRGMPFAWSINPYRGCSHACAYCFARPTHGYLNLSPLGDFERTVVVKVNVVEVLRRELAKPSWRGEHVAMGTNTDPYQRCEGRYALMPGIVGALAEARTPFSVLTKGTLILRDLEPLAAAAERVEVGTALTIGMLDEALWRDVEPGTPSPRARLEAVARLREAGVGVSVMLAPIMPGLNDDAAQLRSLAWQVVEAGAAQVTPIALHLRPGVREVFWPWLEERRPELVDRYAELYRGSNAPRAYRERVCGIVREAVAAARRRHGAPPARPSRWRGGWQEAPANDADGEAAEQMRLL